ncbi:MAG TPA: hypothetical protein VJH75_01515 [Patescibacteria group bacterium]|nr:hypothetical protein [Patescibacteria group bacterium]
MAEEKLGRAVAFVGPPHSGKSVFLAELYRQLLAEKTIGSKAFLQRACPDGEGMWSAEADQVLVKKLRQKGSFDEPTMNFFVTSIRGLRRNKPIVLVDCGGRRSNQNAVILQECSDAVILSSNPEEFAPWKEFCAANGVNVIAEFKSELLTLEQREELDSCLREGRALAPELVSQVETNRAPFTGTIRDLDRDRPPVTYKEALHEVSVAMGREFLENKEGREQEIPSIKIK